MRNKSIMTIGEWNDLRNIIEKTLNLKVLQDIANILNAQTRKAAIRDQTWQSQLQKRERDKPFKQKRKLFKKLLAQGSDLHGVTQEWTNEWIREFDLYAFSKSGELWCPANHRHFYPRVRQKIWTILLCHKRAPLNCLPRDVLLIVIRKIK